MATEGPPENSPEKSPSEQPSRPSFVKRSYDHIRKRFDDEGAMLVFDVKALLGGAALAATFYAGHVVEAVDVIFDTTFADDMANVRVEPEHAWPVRTGQAVIQCIGLEGDGRSPYKCQLPGILFDW